MAGRSLFFSTAHCQKQPRNSHLPFYKFSHPIVSAKVSGMMFVNKRGLKELNKTAHALHFNHKSPRVEQKSKNFLAVLVYSFHQSNQRFL